MAPHAPLKETAMWLTRIIFVLALIAVASCRDNPTIGAPNKKPIADARLKTADGQLVDLTVEGGDVALMLEYSGTPVTITLDGSASKDEDGKIETYRWLSGTIVPDGGTPTGDGMFERRWIPEGANEAWPADDQSVKIDLPGEGVYTFNLWVIDDGGAISAPDAIKITVGSAVDPAVTECVANVVDAVDEACSTCLCGVSDACRAAVVQSACDEVCWGLIQCIGAMCPDFAANPSDTSCVVAMCADFLAGATPAGAVGDCIPMCSEECRSM